MSRKAAEQRGYGTGAEGDRGRKGMERTKTELSISTGDHSPSRTELKFPESQDSCCQQISVNLPEKVSFISPLKLAHKEDVCTVVVAMSPCLTQRG